MQIEILFPVIIASYLIGSISFSRFVSRLAAPGVNIGARLKYPDKRAKMLKKFSAVGATVTL